MGEFKGIQHGAEQSPPALNEAMISASIGLFEDFDPSLQGGLRVLPDGQVVELRHPHWGKEGATLPDRAIPLLIRVSEKNGERAYHWLGKPLDPHHPTLGVESEQSVMDQAHEWFEVSPDGKNLIYPSGLRETFDELHQKTGIALDPEALKVMVEHKTPVARSYGELKDYVLSGAANVERWLDQHNLESPNLSLHPDDFARAAICQLIYILKVTSRNSMPNMREFGVMSEQLHVQIDYPEAAAHATNLYQGVQAIPGLVTAAAPIRDGSFDTTIGQHYRLGETITQPTDPDELLFVTLPKDDYLKQFADHVPYDWREPARVIGSPVAGALPEAAPISLEAVLRKADALLRNGDIPTSGRALARHGERQRYEIGSIEICNLGTAGGNIYKKMAVHELVAKFMVAQQLNYSAMRNPGAATSQARYQAIVEAGHINNIRAALFGKSMRVRDRQGDIRTEPTTFIGMDGRPATATKILRQMLDHINQRGRVPVTNSAQQELFTTLSPQPLRYRTAETTFSAFFRPYSPMTATDALRHAHAVEPEISTNELLSMFAGFRRRHVFELEAERFFGDYEDRQRQALQRAGALAVGAR
jgi:hypothetical protein